MKAWTVTATHAEASIVVWAANRSDAKALARTTDWLCDAPWIDLRVKREPRADGKRLLPDVADGSTRNDSELFWSLGWHCIIDDDVPCKRCERFSWPDVPASKIGDDGVCVACRLEEEGPEAPQRNSIILGDSLGVLKEIDDCSIDAVITDPPYGLAFMGKRWDYDVPSVELWRETLRVLKPGGYLLSFAGTRTQHRIAAAIEDAGFEIRDMIAWIYGSGFPKSLDVSKAIDKAKGAEREPGRKRGGAKNNADNSEAASFVKGAVGYSPEFEETRPATEEAKAWEGWGTALKPALEPITVARKPLAGTVAANVLEYGTGALNLDACRVGLDGIEEHKTEARSGLGRNVYGKFENAEREPREIPRYDSKGRFPANLIHDGSPEAVEGFPVDGKESAARFFYTAKANKAERDAGLRGFVRTSAGEITGGRKEGSAGLNSPRAGAGRTSGARNFHPTVKPLALMAYLVRLVTRKGGLVLDPFAGSGTTCKAAVLEGREYIGIERDPEYAEIARARVAHADPLDTVAQECGSGVIRPLF